VPSVDRRSSGPLRWQKKVSCCELFEFSRPDLAERRMPTPLLIEHFDVIEQLHLGFAAAVEVSPELALHARFKGWQPDRVRSRG